MNRAARHLPFPQNLTPGQRLYIEAVDRHGTQTAAADALSVSVESLRGALTLARLRVGVKSTAELVQKYREATT